MIKRILLKYSHWFQDYFTSNGLNIELSKLLNIIIIGILFFGIIYVFDKLIKSIVIKLFKYFSSKSSNTFDDYLVLSNFPRYISHTLPLFITWHYVTILFKDYPFTSNFLLKAIELYSIILSVIIVRSVLKSVKNYLLSKEKYKDKPLESYIQVLMIFTWGIGIFLIINNLTSYSIASVASLSAASAVILLIFKDTLLGFVASIQVTVNDIIRIGDWITFSKYGADGTVIEISLATVRVQNFDKTYTTIPTYSLTSESFQNWRGMENSGGRRIKRAIYIKQNTVKFLSEEDLTKYKKIQLVSNYLEHRQKDNETYNKKNEIDTTLKINGKNQTNLGLFRKYIDAYLNENPAINKEMFLMVRHLAPTEKGIPVEVYCFSKDKKWVNYEHIQADIFDHLLASALYFDLEVFEFPSGNDFNNN
ncbi:MAG: mechanosensitive ion channel family protein [Flavobacteriaceae bacterium]|nr:mechanosensitive ion channel family protein [Flavobacteriaceae bacterium]